MGIGDKEAGGGVLSPSGAAACLAGARKTTGVLIGSIT